MDNENSAVLYKETLYDKIFKPQVITLANGHSVLRRRSRAPLIVVLLALAIWLSLRMTGFDIAVVIHKFSKMLDLLAKIFQPNWEFFPKVVSPLIDTIKMSVLGTVIGCVLALPVAILSSSNINRSLPLVSFFRFILALIRTLPTLIIALVCALIFSLGTFSGTVAIAIFTFGIVAKMLFESIETIDMGPFEAMEALGLHVWADGAADIRAFVVLKMALLHSPVYNVNSALDETPLIRVLNAENELALIVAGNEIGIERGTEIADVHVPRGGRGETRAYLARGDALFHILKPLHVFHFVPPAPKYLRLTFLILFCKLAVVKTNLF